VFSGVFFCALRHDWVNFRNNVIHQGCTPTVEEASEFGEYCLRYIFDVLKAVGEKFPGAIQRMMMDLQKEIETAAGVDRIPSKHIRQVVLQTSLAGTAEFGKGTLQQSLDTMRSTIRKNDDHGRSI
jgi:hypothetical protein